jgi:Tol biopolymer transport system component
VATRASRSEPFSEASHVDELSTEHDDLPRAPNATGTFLPLARKGAAGDTDLWIVPLSAGPTYGEPEALSELNTTSDESDPTLSADGLTILFASDRDEPNGDLYRAVRANLASPFSEPRPLSELNTEFEESDPWLRGDESGLLFTSRRTGQLEVYEADRL